MRSLEGGAICIQQLLDIGPGIGKHFCKCSSSWLWILFYRLFANYCLHIHVSCAIVLDPVLELQTSLVLVFGLAGLVLVLVLDLEWLVIVLILGLECLVSGLVLGLEGKVIVNITASLTWVWCTTFLVVLTMWISRSIRITSCISTCHASCDYSIHGHVPVADGHVPLMNMFQ